MMIASLPEPRIDGRQRVGVWFGAVLRRLRALVEPSLPADFASTRRRELAEVCAVLGEARTVLEHGWVQNRWQVKDRPPGAGDAADHPGETRASCLVAAVMQAGGERVPGEFHQTGPALDLLWDALQESRGFRGPGVAGRAAPASVRTARVRDLTRWNDRPERTRQDVLHLIDLAISRGVLEAMSPRLPAELTR